MPNLWDRTPDTSLQSELNPLTNPALERNLGRWAQVYFNNPPGKREQAVSKLLQEIKRESLGELADEIICPACQHKNSSSYKFCGRCGGALKPVVPSSNANPHFTTIRVPVERPRGPAQAPLPQFESDLQWLRDKTFRSMDVSDAPEWKGWKYLIGGMVIALAGAAYLQRWSKADVPANPQTIARSSEAVARPLTAPGSAAVEPQATAVPKPQVIESSPQVEGKQASEATAPATPAAALAKPQVMGNSLQGEVKDTSEMTPADSKRLENLSAPFAGPNTGIASAKLKRPALLPGPSGPLSAAREGGESGVPDLRLAERYLGGSMGVRDSSVAAKLLWNAVRKQNTTAAVLLSNLYLRGDGVPRSCDQARILLVAAAKRGAPEAAQQLRNLEVRGCH